MSDDNILLIVGVIGAILGAVDVYRSKAQDIAAIGVVVIGVGLAIIGLKPN
jgi:hypothetical protein